MPTVNVNPATLFLTEADGEQHYCRIETGLHSQAGPKINTIKVPTVDFMLFVDDTVSRHLVTGHRNIGYAVVSCFDTLFRALCRRQSLWHCQNHASYVAEGKVLQFHKF